MEFEKHENDFLNNNNKCFVQYQHVFGACFIPCYDCIIKHNRIYEDNHNLPIVGEQNHPKCHCYYKKINTIAINAISKKGLNSPAVWLKLYGELPDYYITKDEARKHYGWDNSKNTLNGKAPGKMLGGDIYKNIPPILPTHEGRIWYECDVDYTGGKRNSLRLYYSNDGLMFYSDDHGKSNFYQVI